MTEDAEKKAAHLCPGQSFRSRYDPRQQLACNHHRHAHIA